jgi:glucose-6-phosphate-specific signal transduction histidine kinase
MEKGNYKKYLLMLSLSFIIMYSVMYLNADRFDHIYLSLNRFYMTVLMVAPMALIMLLVMSSMYKNKKLNRIIITLSITFFIAAVLLLRYQTFIGDKNFMLSMIPHHSSAILVSQEATLTDPEVKKLAEDIIKSQEEEIAQMKNILERMDN